MYLRTLKAARSAKNFWEEIFMPKSQLGGILYIFPPEPRGGCLYFPLKHKSAMYTFVQQRGGGSRRDPNHKSMYKCAYMYVHLSHSPPPPPASGNRIAMKICKDCVLESYETV